MNSITIGSPTGDPVTTTTADQVAFSPSFTSLSIPGLASFSSGTVVTPLAADANGVIMLNSSTDTAENKLTTEGQLLSVASNGTLTAIDIGAPGQILTVSDGMPTWENAPTSSNDAASVMTTEGDILTVNATGDLSAVSIGSTNQVLTVSGGLPSWQNTQVTTPNSAQWGGILTTPTGTENNGAKLGIWTSSNADGIIWITASCSFFSYTTTDTTSTYTYSITEWPGSPVLATSNAIINSSMNTIGPATIYSYVDTSASNTIVSSIVFTSPPASGLLIEWSVTARYPQGG